MTENNDLNERRWRNRRRMAYISLFFLIIVAFLAIFVVPVERLQVLEEIITWFFFIMGSVVGAYVGFSTLDDKWNKNK
jgi:O-antigen ligase